MLILALQCTTKENVGIHSADMICVTLVIGCLCHAPGGL